MFPQVLKALPGQKQENITGIFKPTGHHRRGIEKHIVLAIIRLL